MNRFIAFLKSSTKQIFFLPLSINTLISETSVTHMLLLAGDSHFRAHLCIIKKSFCVIIFVLKISFTVLWQGLCAVLLLSHLS